MTLDHDIVSVGVFLSFMFIAPVLLRLVGLPYILSFMALGFLGKYFVHKEITEKFEFFEISAIILLFFFIGLEYSFERLKGMVKIWKAGAVDLFFNFIPVFMVSYLFSKDLLFSLFVASVLYPSSTSIVAKLLMDYRRLINPEAELLIGILIFEDLVSIVLLSFLTPISLGRGMSLMLPVKGLLATLLVFTFFYIFNRYVIPRIVYKLDVLAESSLLPFFVLGILLTLSGIGHSVGISEALIAFMLGVLVPENSKISQAIESQLSSLKELSIGVFFFFFTYKANLDFGYSYVLIVLLAFLALFLKLVSTYMGAKLYGLGSRSALRASLSFLPRGEFSVVFASLYSPVQGLTFLLVLITSFIGSISFVLAPKISNKLFPKKTSKKPPA